MGDCGGDSCGGGDSGGCDSGGGGDGGAIGGYDDSNGSGFHGKGKYRRLACILSVMATISVVCVVLKAVIPDDYFDDAQAESVTPSLSYISQGTFTCPTGSYMSQMISRVGTGLDYIDSFVCTDGTTIIVNVGNSTSTNICTSAIGPFNSYAIEQWTEYQGAISGLSLQTAGVTSSISAPCGNAFVEAHVVSCPFDEYMSGITVASAVVNFNMQEMVVSFSASCYAAPTMPMGTTSTNTTADATAAPTHVASAVPTQVAESIVYSGTFTCPAGYISQMFMRGGANGVNYVDSFTCTDSSTSTVAVHIGDSLGGDTYISPFGPFNSYTYTKFGTYDWAVSGLMLATPTYVSPPCGTAFMYGQVIVYCAPLQFITGITVSAAVSGMTLIASFSAICA